MIACMGELVVLQGAAASRSWRTRAVQQAAALDGKGDGRGDVGLEGVGGAKVERGGGRVRRVLALDARLRGHHGGDVHVGAKGARLPLAAPHRGRDLPLKVVEQEYLRAGGGRWGGWVRGGLGGGGGGG